MNVKFLMSFSLFLTFTTMIFAQEKLINGVVRDNKQNPLSGVLVTVKETGKTTQTDSTGAYTIAASEGNNIIFTMTGFGGQSYIVDATNTVINVMLVPGDSGQAVAAMGIARDAKSLGYTTESVSGDQASSTDASAALAGNTTGVSVASGGAMGSGTNITIRGNSSVTGSSAPLVVIDGVPLEASAMKDINPDDIETQTVLKGGAATALYGSRGGNGVIIITTKSGKGGKTAIDIKSGVTLESVSIIPDFQNEYGGGSKPSFDKYVDPATGIEYNIPEYKVDESWGPKFEGQDYLPWSAFDKDMPGYMQTKKWLPAKRPIDKIFRTGATYSNSVSFTRSLAGANIRVSLGNNKTLGIVPNAEISRTNLSFSFNTKLSERLKADGGFNYVTGNSLNEHHQRITQNLMAHSALRWWQRQLDVNELKNYKSTLGRHRSWNIRSPQVLTPEYSDNPFWMLYENTYQVYRQRFYGNIGLTYNIRPDLYVVGKMNGDVSNMTSEEIRQVQSNSGDGEPFYSVTSDELKNYNYELRLHYEPNLGDNWTLTSFLGTSRYNSKEFYMFSTTMSGLNIEGLNNLSNSIQNPKGSNDKYWNRTNSIYGMFNIGYKETVFLEGTGRKDWFSTVVEPIFYPSATVSFVFSNVLPQNKVLTFGKLRAGWAEAGKDTGPYRLKEYVNIHNVFKGAPANYASNVQNNETLKPEVTRTTEGGIELGFFNNINLSVTYYDSRTRDLILTVPVEAGTGKTYKLLNSGVMQNKGIELSLSATPVTTNNFSWNTSLNFTKNTNKLLELHKDVKVYQLKQTIGGAFLVAEENQPYGIIKGRNYVYLNGKKVIDDEGFYKMSKENESLGDINPDYSLGFNNSFSYKNLSLNVLLDYQHGGSYYSTSHAVAMGTGLLQKTVEYEGVKIREQGIILEGVKEDGTPNDKRISGKDWALNHYQNGVNAQNVFDASYLKLRDVSLSYNMPLPQGSFVKGVVFTAFGRNLMTWGLAWEGADPEVMATMKGFETYGGGGTLPSTRSYGLSVGLKL